MVKRYRLKPQEIEAIQFTRTNWSEVVEFTGGLAHDLCIGDNVKCLLWCDSKERSWITVRENEYIVKYKDGSFGLFDARHFNRLYEEIELTGDRKDDVPVIPNTVEVSKI